MSVSAIVDADDADLFGKVASDLQEDIEVGDDAITGTLKYVADYSSAFGTGELGSGNYIALHMEVPNEDDVTITVKITNPVTLDSDGNFVGRIADKSTQTITVVASKEGWADVTKEYDLTGLTCNVS